jgi:hypothetical protein
MGFVGPHSCQPDRAARVADRGISSALAEMGAAPLRRLLAPLSGSRNLI